MTLARERWGWARSAWAPALVIFVGLGALLGVYFALGGDIRDFLHLTPYVLIHGANASPYLHIDPTYHGYALPNSGYDGQFYYYIAVDPQHAPAYLDNPAYRFSRPLYPFLARALGFGQPAVIPWAMLGINWLAISGAVLALGDVLRRRGFSPWFALIYALYPGLMLSFRTDVTEPLAYGLVALGIWSLERGGRRAWLWAGVAFALAALTRETTAVFPLAVTLGAAIAGINARRTEMRGMNALGKARALLAPLARPALWGIGVIAPYAIWKALLTVWFGSSGVPSTLTPEWFPLAGLAQLWPWPPSVAASALFVALPGGVCVALGVWGLWRRPDEPAYWALIAQTFVCCFLMRPIAWDLVGMLRLSIGAPLALLWALPSLLKLSRRAGPWLAGVFTLSMALAPSVMLSFFPNFAKFLGLL